MLHTHLQGRGTKVYCGVGLLLLVLSPFYYAHLFAGLNVSVAVSAVCLAALSCSLGFLQNTLAFPGSVKTLMAWLFGVGTILSLNSWPWLQDFLAAWVRDVEWRRRVGMIDLVFPAMILFPVGAVFIGILCGERKWPSRAYLLGGLCLVFVFIGDLWFNLFNIHFAATTEFNSFRAGLLWTPASLVVATAGMILGCVPQDLHPPSRFGSAMALCYILGIGLIPLGFYASVNGDENLAYLVLLAVMAVIFAPSAVVTRRWIITRPTGRSL